MENKGHESMSTAHFHQPQWLQKTISDFDEKMKAMMSIIEYGRSSNQEADMDHKRKEELTKMLEDLSKSYRAIVIEYNQLKSETFRTFHLGSSSSTSNTSRILCAICNERVTANLDNQKLEEDFSCHLKSIVDGPDINFEGTNLDFGHINKLKDKCYELMSSETCSVEFICKDTQMEDRMADFPNSENVMMKIEGFELSQGIEDQSVINYKFDNMWSAQKFQIMKLTEDNLRQLVELIRRNDEKRKTIKRLQSELEALKHENRALQISLRYSKADSEWNQPRIAKSGGISMGKLFRGCSP